MLALSRTFAFAYRKVLQIMQATERKVAGLPRLMENPGDAGAADRPGKLRIRRYGNLPVTLRGKSTGQSMVLGRGPREDYFPFQRPAFHCLADIIARRGIGQAGQLGGQRQPARSGGNKGRLGKKGADIPQVNGVLGVKSPPGKLLFDLHPQQAGQIFQESSRTGGADRIHIIIIQDAIL